MDVDLCAKWFPENWKNMNEMQLYGHFNKYFCTEMRFVKDWGNYFEQLLSSKVFGSKLRNVYQGFSGRVGVINNFCDCNQKRLTNKASDEIASEFNEMTRRGQRKCMSDEFFNIWFRSILKQIIKPERYVLVCKNMEDAIKTPNFKRKCGQFIDALLDSIENYENAFLGKPTSGNGYKIDDCIRKFLPELLNSHVKPFSTKNEGCPLNIALLDTWGRDSIDITREKLVVHIGKFTAVKWERYAFVKGGGAFGENMGKLTKFTYLQMQKADEIASSILGNDAGVLAPHTYSKIFLTELQSSFQWNKEKRMWATQEFPINTKDRDITLLNEHEDIKFSVD